MKTEAAKVGHLAHQTVVALAVLTVALMVVGSLIVWAELRTDDVYKPLHYDNPQTVTSRVNIMSGAPAARIGDTVNVTGTKCADEEVDIIAVTSWKPIEPRGTSIVVGDAHAATRDAGCVTDRFQNDIPDEVIEVVRRQHARGYPAPLWQITSSETPIAEDGSEGATEVWYTEPFAIVARDA